MSKAIVLSVSKGSAGSVPVKGNITTSGNIVAGNGIKAGYMLPSGTANSGEIRVGMGITTQKPDASALYPVTITQSGSITATGSTDLTTKQYSAKLISATQLQCDGPVEWQVIEYA